jgi:hypothetical protein
LKVSAFAADKCRHTVASNAAAPQMPKRDLAMTGPSAHNWHTIEARHYYTFKTFSGIVPKRPCLPLRPVASLAESQKSECARCEA